MHKALYRTFRPMKFGDVVGQDHIIRTLKNQISGGNVAHAYLFSGTRGTGKTSTAKIFARSINCLSPADAEPCNSCEMCRAIIDENIMDVVEIDAASNNGVDDIRELRENVKYPPARGRYKVYIVDEVHMLSQGAFNALLKTLEEPPSYVVFILATTEPHKLPATILSRCQRFDFKRLGLGEIVGRMKGICAEVGVCADEEALNLIGMSSQGAMRDALSILDQCMSYSSECISYEDVVSLLGTVNFEALSRLSDAIIRQDVKACLEMINELVVWGKDIKNFTQELTEHFRNIIIAKLDGRGDGILGVTGEMAAEISRQSQGISGDELIRIIKQLSALQNDMRYASNPRIVLEVAIMKICSIEEDSKSEALIARISRLERLLSGVKAGAHTAEAQSQPKEFEKPKEATKLTEDEPEVCKNASEKKRIERQNDDIDKLWKDILGLIKDDRRIPVQAMLKEGTPLEIGKGVFKVMFKDSFDFHRKALSKDENAAYLRSVVKRVTGEDMYINLVIESEISSEKSPQEDAGDEIRRLEEIFPPEVLQIKDSLE